VGTDPGGRVPGAMPHGMDKFKNVLKAVDYILYLTSQRKTPEYKREGKEAYYGLLIESISHEGYSAKPKVCQLNSGE